MSDNPLATLAERVGTITEPQDAEDKVVYSDDTEDVEHQPESVEHEYGGGF